MCFELWLLSHFTPSSACYESCDNLISGSVLKNELTLVGIEKYKKAHSNIFRLIKNRLPNAILNCERINSNSKYCSFDTQPYNLNPYTDVHELLIDIKNFVDGNQSIRSFNDLERKSCLKLSSDFFAEKLKS